LPKPLKLPQIDIKLDDSEPILYLQRRLSPVPPKQPAPDRPANDLAREHLLQFPEFLLLLDLLLLVLVPEVEEVGPEDPLDLLRADLPLELLDREAVLQPAPFSLQQFEPLLVLLQLALPYQVLGAYGRDVFRGLAQGQLQDLLFFNCFFRRIQGRQVQVRLVHVGSVGLLLRGAGHLRVGRDRLLAGTGFSGSSLLGQDLGVLENVVLE